MLRRKRRSAVNRVKLVLTTLKPVLLPLFRRWSSSPRPSPSAAPGAVLRLRVRTSFNQRTPIIPEQRDRARGSSVHHGQPGAGRRGRLDQATGAAWNGPPGQPGTGRRGSLERAAPPPKSIEF
ncbi:hypothetical protein EYF80_056592 [Liparis tanakae]|uniref:Uncharacterized protein n=1 Tax=Liparis tanakae TaxID=230148 RepID=A0A4Z2EY35_9TELE|nr:hypothetical protein EYF80_056592 [Liparis tanakae]